VLWHDAPTPAVPARHRPSHRGRDRALAAALALAAMLVAARPPAPVAAQAGLTCVSGLPGCPSVTPGGSPGGTAPGGGGAAAPVGATGGSPPRGVALSPVGNPEVGIEDENVVFGPQARQVAATWRALGVEYVRVMAYWNALAPAATATAPPAGFDPADPYDPGYAFGPLDAAVDAIADHGMRPMLTLNQSGPRWASTQPSVATPAWRPSPARFAQFATAVARRYGARVDRYLIGNEPNQRVFLSPQFTCRRRSCAAVAPHLYRDLVNAAYPAIKRADPRAQVLIGELAPIGSPPSPRSGMAPLPFLRAMGCVDSRYRRVTTGMCRRFFAPRGDGFGYHPYVNTKSPPTRPTRNPNLAKIGDLPRLLRVVDRLTATRRLRATTGRFRLYLTEFGYISNPPNPRFGVSLAAQARYLSQSAYVVWRQRARVRLITQYQWRDDAVFPTGLLFADGTPKPSLAAFPNPFFVDTSRGLSRAVFWGQVRPDSRGGATVQVRPRGDRAFQFVRAVRTDRGGYWAYVARALPGATYRFRYAGATGTVASQALTVPRR
jgi:hypothetical protein